MFTTGGAKNHALILPDANIEDSTKQIIGSFWPLK